MKKKYLVIVGVILIVLVVGRIGVIIIEEISLGATTIKKPNIYLYPTKQEQLSVKVNPKGSITKSIPEYKDGWNVLVTPDGKINNKYDFLFYEANVKFNFSLNNGWIVKKDTFNTQINSILTRIGLNEKEKEDFIEYWSKELQWKKDQYAVYYLFNHEIDTCVPLEISHRPDSILRAFFYFIPVDTDFRITEPVLRPFEREGFTLVEWGGIGK